MLENGYIKLYRSITTWRWYDDINTTILFIHLLLTVSIKTSQWHDETIKRGERVVSRKQLSKELHISEQNIRTALKHLKSTKEIAIRSTRKYSVITVNNFDRYQEVPSSVTNRRPSDGQPHTDTSPQYKKVEEDSKKEKEKSGAPAQYSPEEWEALKARLRR
jgi:biotin operon repressor